MTGYIRTCSECGYAANTSGKWLGFTARPVNKAKFALHALRRHGDIKGVKLSAAKVLLKHSTLILILGVMWVLYIMVKLLAFPGWWIYENL